jgi:hypothetical protein
MAIAQGMTELATVTLSANSTSIIFSNIPNTFRDLVVQGQAAAGQNTYIILNGDGTNASYSSKTMYGEASTISSTFNNDARAISLDQSPNTAFKIEIFSYAKTDRHTQIISQSGAIGIVRTFGVRWKNTAAVNSVRLNPQSGYPFLAGSTFSIYGVGI